MNAGKEMHGKHRAMRRDFCTVRGAEAALVVWILLSFGSALASDVPDRRGWPAYDGGVDNWHYSSLRQINRVNVKELQVAWTLDTGDVLPHAEMESNPLIIGNTIYLVSPKLNVIAADAATGKPLWRFDPHHGKRVLGGYRNRGLNYWSDAGEGRIFIVAKQYLYALDSHTGLPVQSFGHDGRIDLREGLDRDPATQSISLSSPGVVYKDLLIIGSLVAEDIPAPYGDIRAYDVRTGALRWTFHTIPRPGEFGYQSWPKDAWKHTGSANNWSGMALDVERGIVYVPTGSAVFDYYGGDRPGDDLFANCLLALDANTGKRLWHYQVVHHDTWDRDLPTAPTLVTVMRDGKQIDAVAQPTKSGYVLLFDRTSGKPLFPIEERKVASTAGLPGEVLSPNQPFPLRPIPFARQLFTEDLLTDLTPEAHAQALAEFKHMRHGGQFVPMSTKGTLVLPGLDGGAEWGGAAYDPETGLLYINSNDVPWYVHMHIRPAGATGERGGRAIYLRECAGCHGADREGMPPQFPSLIGIGDDFSVSEVASFVYLGSGRMPGFSRLDFDSLLAVAQYVVTGQDHAVAAKYNRASPPYQVKYGIADLGKLQDSNGYPAIKPPWGTLSAINMNSGDYAWRIPFGEYPELVARGIKNTGSENYGGGVVTAGGLLFIGATNQDRKFHAFDKLTGELLWEATLPAAGNATPAVYEAHGREFVVIGAGGGKSKAFSRVAGSLSQEHSGGTYVAFALPQTQ
jgi:quinoprotein glucose dehydrogenase